MRDYGINLVEHIHGMTWRLFMVLCSNLSPYGAVAVRIRADEERRRKNPEPDERDEASDRRAAEAFFSSVISV